MTVYSSVLDMIGNTPLVDVSQLSPNPNVRILGKMEGQNPAGSVKDRIALSMITEAEADGTLTPGCTIIEPSSGNTGIAMAMISRIKGYKIKIVYSPVAGTARPAPTRHEWWKALAVAALAVILFEWYVYNRRVYI